MGVNLLHNIYQNNLFENEKKIAFWEDYLQNLNVLDFKVFTEKLSVPALVPVGSKMFFRGQLKHTNEITVALGADYFAKCSAQQAEVLREHRIKDAKSKLELLKHERDFLKNQLSFSKQNVFEEAGHDIIEVFTEEEDKAWREQHREKIRQYKQNKDKNNEAPPNEMTDEELWNRLEELELQEELENELSNNESKKQLVKDVSNEVKDMSNKPMVGRASFDENNDEDDSSLPNYLYKSVAYSEAKLDREIHAAKRSGRKEDIPKQTSKLDLLEQVIERQNFVTDVLSDQQNKDIPRSKTEAELLAKLDELEKAEELDDELNRLDRMMQIDNITELYDEDEESGELYEEDDEDDNEECDEDDNEEGGEEAEKGDTEESDGEETDEEETDGEENEGDLKQKRMVSFADENDSETLEVTFKHSDVEPNNAPYDHKKGITKPSDVYEAYSSLFNGETSILKKTKYGDIPPEDTAKPTTVEEVTKQQDELKDVNRTIVVKDIVEKVDHNDNQFSNNGRPMSLFKKRRQHQK